RSASGLPAQGHVVRSDPRRVSQGEIVFPPTSSAPCATGAGRFDRTNVAGSTAWLHLFGSKRGVHCQRGELPTFGLGLQALSAGGGKPVELGLPVVSGNPPLGIEQPLVFQSVQRRIERALLNGQRVTCDLFDAKQHAVAMLGAERHSLQNQ